MFFGDFARYFLLYLYAPSQHKCEAENTKTSWSS